MQVWPIQLDQPLPEVPVPLLPGDPDVLLDLQQVLTTTYDGDVELPNDATDTGYEYDNWHLWLAADRSAAYVVDVDDPARAERWPAAKDMIACA